MGKKSKVFVVLIVLSILIMGCSKDGEEQPSLATQTLTPTISPSFKPVETSTSLSSDIPVASEYDSPTSIPSPQAAKFTPSPTTRYDYSSFIGEWQYIEPDNVHGINLTVDSVKNNNEMNITIYDNITHENLMIVNNQVKFNDTNVGLRHNTDSDLVELTFHDDFILATVYSKERYISDDIKKRSELENYIDEYRFTSDTIKPHKSPPTIQNVCNEIKNFDFIAKKFLINTAIMTPKQDEIYKKAYFNAITGKAFLKRIFTEVEADKEVYFGDLVNPSNLSDEDFLRNILETADYHYMDFDGDGLPELIITIKEPFKQGVFILKYILSEEQVYLIYGTDSNWNLNSRYHNLLGSSQIYYYNGMRANKEMYAYETLDKNGETNMYIYFETKYVPDGKDDWNKEYYVAMEGYTDNDIIELDKKSWDEVTQGFFKSIKNPIPPVSFDTVFQISEK